MLKIKNLTLTVEDQIVIENLDLEVQKDQVHAIIGPTKSGKTALTFALAGLPFVEVAEGNIQFKNKKLTNQKMHERSQNGLLCIFQDLVEINNVTNWELIQEVLKYRKDKRDINEVKELYNSLCQSLELGEEHPYKEPNSDHMNYEQAIKNELLTSLIINPDLVVFDNLDEKLDEENKKIYTDHVSMFTSKKGKATVVLSKNKSVLEAINPTHVHIIVNGKLAMSGGKELLQRIEEDGYSEFSAS